MHTVGLPLIGLEFSVSEIFEVLGSVTRAPTSLSGVCAAFATQTGTPALASASAADPPALWKDQRAPQARLLTPHARPGAGGWCGD